MQNCATSSNVQGTVRFKPRRPGGNGEQLERVDDYDVRPDGPDVTAGRVDQRVSAAGVLAGAAVCQPGRDPGRSWSGGPPGPGEGGPTLRSRSWRRVLDLRHGNHHR